MVEISVSDHNIDEGPAQGFSHVPLLRTTLGWTVLGRHLRSPLLILSLNGGTT